MHDVHNHPPHRNAVHWKGKCRRIHRAVRLGSRDGAAAGEVEVAMEEALEVDDEDEVHVAMVSHKLKRLEVKSGSSGSSDFVD